MTPKAIVGFLLLAGGGWLYWRSKTQGGATPSTVAPPESMGFTGGAPSNVGSTINIGSDLASAVDGLVRGIWGPGGGQGYGGFISIETADGSLKYNPPNNTLPVLNSRIGKRLFDP